MSSSSRSSAEACRHAAFSCARSPELRQLRTGIGGFEVDNFAQQNVGIVQLVTPDDDRLEVSGLSPGQRSSISRPASIRTPWATPAPSRATSSTVVRADHALDRRYGRSASFLVVVVATAVPPDSTRSPPSSESSSLFSSLVVVLLVIFNGVDAHIGKRRHRVFESARMYFTRKAARRSARPCDVAASSRV